MKKDCRSHTELERAEHLRTFLPSVVANTHAADIIVADNGSADDSLEVISAQFPL